MKLSRSAPAGVYLLTGLVDDDRYSASYDTIRF